MGKGGGGLTKINRLFKIDSPCKYNINKQNMSQKKV